MLKAVINTFNMWNTNFTKTFNNELQGLQVAILHVSFKS